jgi:hypothetical protein
MLKATSSALQTITVMALLCAFIIRARTPIHAGLGQAGTIPAVPAGFRAAVTHEIDEAWGWDEDMPFHTQESFHETFGVVPQRGPRAIEVANLLGSIEVVGSDDDGVQMDVDKSIRARSNQALERARKEVTLDVDKDPGLLRIEVKYPSPCALPDCWSFEDHSYRVTMNFRLQVPHDSDLTLKTVEGREVRVRDVSGTFSISNVNGAITMEEVAGSGTARTVNGPIKVTFRKNPEKDWQFASVSGGVDLYFPKNLSADFRFRTFSGSVDSDFPILTAPLNVPAEERRGARLYFQTIAFEGGRVGAGGPLIRVESLNGKVRLLEKHD